MNDRRELFHTKLLMGTKEGTWTTEVERLSRNPLCNLGSRRSGLLGILPVPI